MSHKTSYCLIEVVAKAGLTVLIKINIFFTDFPVVVYFTVLIK